MAATVQIIEKNGAGGAQTDKTGGNIRFKKADNATVDLLNPMVKPASGSDWSFQKWLRLLVTGGAYTQISTIRAYTDGVSGFGAGIALWAKAVAAYATPALETSSATYANAFGYTSVAPLSLGAGPYTGTGEIGNHLVMAMEVQNTAAGGITSNETLSIGWDEI